MLEMNLQAWRVRICQEGDVIDSHDRLIRRTCDATGNVAIIEPVADEYLPTDGLAIKL